MLPSNRVSVLIRSARWLGLGALLAALPLTATASNVTVDFTFALNGDPGSGSFIYNSTDFLTDADGNYVDAATGLESFDITYLGTTYDMSEALDSPTLPEVFLPGNSIIVNGPTLDGETYGVLGTWVISGSLAGGDATVLGVGTSLQSYLLFGTSSLTTTGSGSDLLLQFDADSYVLGVFTPEPALLPVLALGLAGLLFFARRRKATQ
jgi:hypothetical protein